MRRSTKNILALVGLAFFLWAFVTVIDPWFDSIASSGFGWGWNLLQPHRYVRGADEFFMADDFRNGTLVVRNFWHCTFKDGFEREYGDVTYGYGKSHRQIVVEVVRDSGQEWKIVSVLMEDGHLSHQGSLWRSPDDPTVNADILRDVTKSLEMGRKRLAAWRQKQKSLPRT